MNKKYKYDAAISFAEEDRNAALALALALELEGVKNMYYYPLHYEDTWGKNLKNKLQDIYSKDARYAIIIISNHYFVKKFCQIELKAIKKRIKDDESVVYMLPVLLAEEVTENIHEFLDLGYFKWDFNPEKIASTIAKLLGKKKELLSEYRKNKDQSIMLLRDISIASKHVHIGNVGKNPGQHTKDIKVMEKANIQTETFHFGNKND